MNTFTKHPRTYHLPWSLGATSDDKILTSLDGFVGHNIVFTEKMDGENTTMYNNHIHARSIDSKHHNSRNWVKALWASIASDIPDGYRICGENLYAKHSVGYDDLTSYFMVHSVWCGDSCLSWSDTEDFVALLGLITVPVLKISNDIHSEIILDTTKQEGYVARIIDSFDIKDFDKVVGKYVRAGHVTTDKHWSEKWTANGLKNN